MGTDEFDAESLRRDAAEHVWIHGAPWGAIANDPTMRVLVEGRGVWVRDAEGKEYIDALAGHVARQCGSRPGADWKGDGRAGKQARLRERDPDDYPARDCVGETDCRARSRRLSSVFFFLQRRLGGGGVGDQDCSPVPPPA